MFRHIVPVAAGTPHATDGAMRRSAKAVASASNVRSSAPDRPIELTSPQRAAVVIAVGLLHLGAAVGLLRLSTAAAPMPPRQTALQVDWIAVAPAAAPAYALVVPAVPTPVPAPLQPARTPPAAPAALLSAAAESPSPVSVAPPAVQAAHAPADEASNRPTEAPAATQSAASVSATNADTATVAPASPPAPKNLPAESVQYLVPPAPVYPRLSRRQGETGRVLVRVYIDEAGLPRSVQLSASSGHGRLDDAALQAVQQARFKPYAENGRPMGGWAFIPLTFDLETSP